MANLLYESLSQTLTAPNISELLDTLKEASLLITASPAPGDLIKLSTINVLKRIKNHFKHEVFLPLSKLYLQIIKQHASLEDSLIIPLCNNIFEICEDTKGTKTSQSLLNEVKSALTYLKSKEQDQTIIKTLNSLLKAYEVPNIDERLHQALDEIRQSKLHGMNSIIEIFSSFENLNIQYTLFQQHFEKLLTELERLNNPLMIECLINLLEMFVFETNFTINLNEEVQCYRISNIDLPEATLAICKRALQLILPYEVRITQRGLIILQRLWRYFPEQKEALCDPIRILLTDIAAEGSQYFKARASEFLYEIHNEDLHGHFKQWLDQDKVIKPLLASSSFRPAEPEVYTLSTLPASIACALNAEIAAGQDFSYFIETTAARSLLVYGFASRYYDVSFRIERVDYPEVLHREERVLCEEKPKTGSILLEFPGLYKLVWVNSFSWFNSKQIRYRVAVLSPCDVQSLPQRSTELIQVFNATLITNSVVAIGIWLKPMIKIYHQGVHSDLQSILDIHDIISGLPQETNVAVGIVGAPPLYVPKLDVQNIYTCGDSEALALLGIENYSKQVVIAVVEEGGVRISVACDSRIVTSVAVKGEMIEELGKFMCLFGPAVVLIAGSVCADVRSIEGALEGIVPEGILQQSFIRESSKLLVVAASRLFTYKKNLDSQV